MCTVGLPPEQLKIFFFLLIYIYLNKQFTVSEEGMMLRCQEELGILIGKRKENTGSLPNPTSHFNESEPVEFVQKKVFHKYFKLKYIIICNAQC